MLLDYGKAILTIREHAVEWNIDPAKSSILGFSDGGHLRGTIATQWQNGVLSEAFGVPSEVFKPLCVMLIYPAADFVQQEQFRKKASEKPMSTINMNRAWFGQEDPGDEALAEASPARNVTKDCPPVFLTAARDDDLVDAACSLNMAMALQSAGVPYEHMYE